MTNRQTNHRLAVIYFVAAMVLFSVSAFFFYHSGRKEASTSKHSTIQCQNELKSMDFESSLNTHDGQIVVRHTGAESIAIGVANASIAISRCVGYQLKTFCAGSGCPTPGIHFTLHPVL